MLNMLQLKKKLINVINETKVVKARLQTRINALLTRITILKREIKVSNDVYNFLNDKVDEIEIRIDMQKINRANSALFFYVVFDVCFYQRSRLLRDFLASSRFVFVFSSLTSKNASIFVFFFFCASKIVRTFLRKVFCVVVVLCVVVLLFDVVFDFFFRFVRVVVVFRVKFNDVVVLFFQFLTTRQETKTSFMTINRILIRLIKYVFVLKLFIRVFFYSLIIY